METGFAGEAPVQKEAKITVRLSWPDKLLNPNSRAHWSKKHGKQKAYKREALYATMAAGLEPRQRLHALTEIRVEIVFHPPDQRSRDEDNALASLKYALDGIAMAIGADDSRFRISHRFGDIEPHGAVAVTLSAVQP